MVNLMPVSFFKSQFKKIIEEMEEGKNIDQISWPRANEQRL